LTKTKKTIITAVIAATICLLLSSFSPIVQSETASNFTLPATIDTYGNAWDGVIAFDLEQTGGVNALVVMDTNGTLVNVRESSSAYGVAYNIAPDTLLFQGEPRVDGAGSAPTYATHIWNMATNTTEDFPNVISHHDIQYDPDNNTFLVLQSYVRDVGNNTILFDKILQVDPEGNILWSWDTYDHIPLSEASTFNETTAINGQTVEDFSHSNSLDWDYNNGIIYLNLRCTNTFYKIDQNTGNILWACGEFGNFTLLDANGNPVSSLWYHSHDTKQVAPDVFTMFDNDYNNVTNPDDCHSRMIELTVNETSMTAYVNWSWEAPTQYWNDYAGGTVLLPNGDYLGDFGDPTHQDPQNQPWNFNNTGAVLVEVNPAGQVVKTFTFPVGCYIYRVALVTDLTSVVTPTPTPTMTPSPSSTPTNPMNSQAVLTFVALPVVIVAIVALAVVFYLRKTNKPIKIGENKK
jgi:hypothetical protein